MSSTTKTATIYLVIYALIFNAVTSSLAFGGPGSMSKEGVLFCTSLGYQWVTVDVKPESENSIKQHCKLCLYPPVDDGFDSILYPLDSRIEFTARQQLLLSQLVTPRRSQFVYLLAQGRAPPLEKTLT